MLAPHAVAHALRCRCRIAARYRIVHAAVAHGTHSSTAHSSRQGVVDSARHWQQALADSERVPWVCAPERVGICTREIWNGMPDGVRVVSCSDDALARRNEPVNVWRPHVYCACVAASVSLSTISIGSVRAQPEPTWYRTNSQSLVDLLGHVVLDVRVLERKVELVSLEKLELVAILTVLYTRRISLSR